MPPETRSTPASAGDWPAAWEAVIERFDAAWQTGSPPRIEAYLPPDAGPTDPLPSLLVELIVMDLEYRWRTAPAAAGSLPARPLLEDYQAAFPALAGDGRLSLDLIGEEYRIRQRWGDRPSRDSYVRRFALGDAEATALFDRLDAQILVEAPRPAAVLAPLAATEEQSVGPYQLLERIGQGWSSNVFRARHTKLNRVVALKLLRKELVAELGPEVIHRFFHEMQAVGRLNHPNVVHAYDAGPVGATYFLALEYVSGMDLDRLVKESGPLPCAQAIAYARQVAEGLRHIHEQGLVHRDLKPSNLLVEQKNNEGAGRVTILDLGFALLRRTAREQSGTGLTGAGDILGSTDYLAPEQALDPHAADHRADLYSLGCTLFFLLTGQPPFAGGTFAQKLHRHQSETPVPLNRIRPQVPEELAKIVSRLLAKRPEERFQTAAEVATALAGAVPSPQRPRPRWQLAGAALLVFALSLLAVWNLSSRHPSRSKTAPLPVHGSAPQQSPVVSIPLDEADATPLVPAEPLPARLWPGKGMRHTAAAWAVAFAPDGLSLASAAEDGVKVWDCRTARERLRFDDHRGIVRSVAFRRDGSLIASGGSDGMVRLWYPETGKELHALEAVGSTISSVAFSSDGREVAAACHLESPILRWNVVTGRRLPALAGHPGGTWAVACGNERTQLASGGRDGTAMLWNLATTKALHALPGHGNGTLGLAWRPRTREIATCGGDSTVSLWKANEPRPRVLRGHTARVISVAYRPDGGLLASGAEDQTVRLWNPDTGASVRTLAMGPGGNVNGISFSPDGRHLAAALNSGVVLVLRLERP